MRDADAAAIAAGTPGRVLMGRAAEALFRVLKPEGETAIVCGAGNNGGDGYALACLLADAGRSCRIWRADARLSEDGGRYFEEAVRKGVPWEMCTDETDFRGSTQIVDCLFGTGFHGEPAGLQKRMIERINESGARVISADIPSGLSGDSGLGDCCVRADVTVSIAHPQPGHYLNRAGDTVGQLVHADIGIPASAYTALLTEEADVAPLLAPRRHLSNKGDYGYVALLGGCRSYSGAAKLASLSLAALRSGCGVSILAVPESLGDAVLPYLLESTLREMPERDGFLKMDAAALDGLMARTRAIAAGMGWGRGPDHPEILTYLLKNYCGKLVLDADALNTMAELDRSLLRETKAQVLLTPHVAEFSRLSGRTKEEILSDPIGTARDYAADTGTVVLLKGPATVLTDGRETRLTSCGCPGMATAGSGDVLTGVLAGLLGYLPCNPETAALGSLLAGLAGTLAEEKNGDISMTAGDTVKELPEAVKRLRAFGKGEKTMVYYKRIPMETLVNTRDLGGYAAGPGKVTRYGVFVRTDCPIGISEADKKKLRDYGITLSIDLRGSDEVQSTPSGLANEPGHTYVHCPISEDHKIIKSNDEKKGPPPAPGPDFDLGVTYVAMLEEGHAWAKKVIELCASWQGGVMFHCFIGKDRAGLIAALILGACGVCDEDIMMDYSASMSCLRPKYRNMGADRLPKKSGRPDFSWAFFGSVPESMETALLHMKEKYGGVEGYLKASGVSDETLQQLRDKLVTDAV